ncbi:MAG: hypothetical protein AAB508_05915 [Patescibacteria group bacterium]
MDTTKLPTRIPKELEHFFWDVKAEEVNPSKHPHYVINRLLDKGDINAARWVIRSFSRKTIVYSLKHGAPMLAINASFWRNYLGISPKEMPKPIPYHKQPSELWRFA